MTPEEKVANRAAFLHVLGQMSGSAVKLELPNSGRLRGIFHTATPFHKKDFLVCIKATRPEGENIDVENGATVMLKSTEWSAVTSGPLDLSVKTELQTDGAIRGKDISHLEGRALVAASDWVTEAPAGGLEANKASVGNWNQFEANARLKDYKKHQFDENLYTKRLDMSAMTPEQIRKAEMLAKEIESQTSGNIHLQEERGHALERDIDEEALYSGVIGTGGYAHGTPKGFSQGGGNDHHANDADGGAWKRGQRPQSGSAAQSPRQQHPDNNNNKAAARPTPTGIAARPSNATANTDPAAAGPGTAPENKKTIAPAPPKAWGAGQAPPSIRTDPSATKAVPTTASASPRQLELQGPPPGLARSPAHAHGSEGAAPASLTTDSSSAAAATASASASSTTASASGTAAGLGPAEANAPVTAPAAAAATATATPAAAAAAALGSATSSEAKPATKLSASAKEWKPNAGAASFVPKGAMGGVPPGPGMPLAQGPGGVPVPHPGMVGVGPPVIVMAGPGVVPGGPQMMVGRAPVPVPVPYGVPGQGGVVQVPIPYPPQGMAPVSYGNPNMPPGAYYDGQDGPPQPQMIAGPSHGHPSMSPGGVPPPYYVQGPMQPMHMMQVAGPPMHHPAYGYQGGGPYGPMDRGGFSDDGYMGNGGPYHGGRGGYNDFDNRGRGGGRGFKSGRGGGGGRNRDFNDRDGYRKGGDNYGPSGKSGDYEEMYRMNDELLTRDRTASGGGGSDMGRTRGSSRDYYDGHSQRGSYGGGDERGRDRSNSSASNSNGYSPGSGGGGSSEAQVESQS